MDTFIVKGSITAALLFICSMQTACNPLDLEIKREEEEPTFRRAERFKREGRQTAALETFLKVIDNRREAPESHLNAGLLYLEYSKEPILAIYHFDQYLRLQPHSDKIDLVQQRIEAAKRLFIENLPGKPYAGDYESLDMMSDIEQLKTENEQLREQLDSTQNELVLLRQRQEPLFFVNQSAAKEQINRSEKKSQPTAAPSPAKSSESRSVSTYVVKKGDTLTRISLKIYQTPARWRDIYAANQNTLTGPDELKVGQVLNLPE